MRQRAGADNLTKKIQSDVRFCFCSVIDNEFRHNIVKVVCGSTSPQGSTATLTMLWRNSLSLTGQTDEKLTSLCSLDNKFLHCSLSLVDASQTFRLLTIKINQSARENSCSCLFAGKELCAALLVTIVLF